LSKIDEIHLTGWWISFSFFDGAKRLFHDRHINLKRGECHTQAKDVISMSELEEIIKELPPDLHQEVVDFARFLMEKRGPKRKGRMKLEWRGALQDMKDEYTSVDLQHKILEWRGD
jgi:hypothetical protein